MSPYSNGFYDAIVRGALQSARVVVPLVTELLRPLSVIDIGCGRGAWLLAFEENGAEKIKGVDGSYVDQGQLLIEPSRFCVADLSEPVLIDDRYDLAVCLEVAEHLPTRAAPALVQTLTSAAPLVLFSAAVPGQGGVCHVNEQWPRYWRDLFAQRRYRMLDPFRRHIIADRRVEWWYRQNLFLFASEMALSSSDALRAEAEACTGPELEWVHSSLLRTSATVRGQIRQLKPVLRAAIRRRVKTLLRRFEQR